MVATLGRRRHCRHRHARVRRRDAQGRLPRRRRGEDAQAVGKGASRLSRRRRLRCRARLDKGTSARPRQCLDRGIRTRHRGYVGHARASRLRARKAAGRRGRHRAYAGRPLPRRTCRGRRRRQAVRLALADDRVCRALDISGGSRLRQRDGRKRQPCRGLQHRGSAASYARARAAELRRAK